MRLKRPRLRTLLLASNLVILALPLSGLWALRLYESALVRQTESELRAQAAVLAGAWRATQGIRGDSLANGLTPRALETARRHGLDLAHDLVLPLAPDPRPGPPPDPLAAEAGARLLPVLRDTQAVTLAALRLLDAAGTVVASTGNDTGLSLAGLEEVEAARAGQPMAVLRQREKIATEVPDGISRTAGLRVHLAMPVMDGERVAAVVLLSRTPATVRQTILRKVPEIAAMGLLLLLLGAALAVLASRLITRPLEAVVQAARQVAAGGRAPPPALPATALREAAELSEAIARMTETLEGRATYVRGLAAHVSHEFKTPLAAMRGAAELLAEHGEAMSAEERARFATTIEEGVARLDRLVRGLLELARADMAAAGGQAALRPLAEAAAARFPALHVTVTGDAVAAMAPDAVATVLDSLLGNTLAHAGPGRAVTIAIARDGPRVALRVADDGPGISAANAARAFDPFFTTARGEGGTGLGLAIARSLVEGAGGEIALRPAGPGVAFRISLPAAAPRPAPPLAEPPSPLALARPQGGPARGHAGARRLTTIRHPSSFTGRRYADRPRPEDSMTHAPDAVPPSLDHSTVEELDAALRVYRRLPLELLGFLILLPVTILGLSRLSTALSPPYGVYLLGQGLVTWGLLLLVALLFGLFWWRARQVARLLNEPAMLASPAMGLLSGTGVIARKATAMGLEWRGFFGPLRPRRPYPSP